ncbi:hypothetical protein KBX50_05300 [Micromonospora sp. C51]|uniref:hypothetical protein n=1 Tax=Micromonospora sp. C51 TaxID=2824879 RepID=UPI001B36E739|nr:hypothetical protein [Micromonospora sp. C51]MBQ1047875.1 hypothetical protein [Micromonospora sp. C51]
MTTVVAAAVAGTVYMAADSCTNVYERPVIDGIRKLLRLPAGNDQVLLGVCGLGGLPGCIAADLKLDAVPKPGEDADAWAHAVARAVTDIAVEAGLVDNGKMDGSVLLGWGGRLWSLSHSTACAHPDGRAALGSGEGPAMGALDVLLDDGVSPLTAVRRAAEMGCRRDRYSEPPIYVEVLSDGEP